MQLTISVSQFGGLLLVQISIFRPKNTRTKAYPSISCGGTESAKGDTIREGGHYPQGGTLSALQIVSGRMMSASGYSPGRLYLLAHSVGGDTFCGDIIRCNTGPPEVTPILATMSDNKAHTAKPTK